MQPMTRVDDIVDFCLEPLKVDMSTTAEREVRRRLEHVIRTFRARAARPVAVDFSAMPLQVINEAAHGNE